MKKTLLFILLAVIVLTSILYTRGQALYVSATVYPYNILDDINRYRSTKGLDPLVESITMCGLAYVRAQQIKTDWSHNQLQAGVDRLMYGGRYYENLARTIEVDQVVPAWIGSTRGHNEAMLVKEMKYGCVVASDKHYVFEGYIPLDEYDIPY